MDNLARIALALEVQPRDLISDVPDDAQPISNVVPADMPTVWVEVPLLGVVMAGKPLMSVAGGMDETIRVPVEACPVSSECYALRVVGDSMIGELIGDGDFVVVRAQNWAENGMLAVVEVNGDACLKHFYLRQDRVELRSQNPAYPPLIVSAAEVAVKGIVVFQMRKYKSA